MDDDVHVFGHEHIRPDVKIQFLASGFQALGQPATCALCLEKCKSSVARTRQVVRVSRFVVIPAMQLGHEALSEGKLQSAVWLGQILGLRVAATRLILQAGSSHGN
jgi:hypothetical protein